MFKLIALDLDGTLFSTFGVLSKEAEQTLKDLRAKGMKIIISSGRPYYSITKSIPEDCYDYASCMNGQDIYIVSEKRHIIEPNLSQEEKEYISSFLEKYRMMMECAFEGDGHYYAAEKHRSFVNHYEMALALLHKIRRTKYYMPEVSNHYEEIYTKEIGKCCFCSYASVLKKFMQEFDNDRFSCFFVNKRWLEIMHKGISKGNAILKIQQFENITKEECIAFGDGENDISMFEVVGTPVAMKNAMRSVKKHAKYVAGLYTEDGCAKWLQDHLLKNDS